MRSTSYVSFWEQFFRSIGLAIINDTLHHVRKPGDEEEIKVVIHKSLGLALLRCSVHVLPVSVSVIILWINFKQTFIGIDFRSLISSETINIALLQTAAKIQELLIVSSLAAVAFQLLRYQLLYGDGLSLGFLAAGFDFVKLSYFWSPEFVGSIRDIGRHRGTIRTTAITVFLILAGGLAAFAGPSCAVLLIPQTQDWPAGSANVYLNGSKEQLWPTGLSAILTDSRQSCTSPNAVDSGVCPSGGYYSLWTHYAQTGPQTFSHVIPEYARQLSGNNYYWSLGSSVPVQARTISLGMWNTSNLDGTSFIQPRLDVAVILNQRMQTWWQGLQSQRGYAGDNVEDRAAVAHLLNPITSVRCATVQNMSASDSAVLFPLPDAQDRFLTQNLNDRWLNREPSRHLRFTWVPLPELGHRISTGAVFQSPWATDNRSRIVIGCTIQARWIPTQIHTDSYSFWQGWYPKNITWEGAYPSSGRPLFNGSSAPDGMDAIATDEDWLEMLTPRLGQGQPGYQVWEPTTIEGIINGAHLVDGLFGNDNRDLSEIWQDDRGARSMLLISIIGSVFNDGIARYGVENIFDQAASPSNWTLRLPGTTVNNTTKLRVNFSIGGLSYKLTVAQKLAAAVLLLHIAIALVHSAWIILTRESSGCWDSITELLALAQNSRPAFYALRNTAAGIKHSATFSRRINIRPTRLSNHPNVGHLEMVYEDEDKPRKENELVSLGEGAHDNAHSYTRPVLHPSTWPARRQRSVTTSNSSVERLNDAETPMDTPLIGGEAGQAFNTSVTDRVRVGHSYG